MIIRISIYDDYIEIFWNHGKKSRIKKGLKANSLCKVREGGVSRATQLFLDGLEKAFNL